MTYETISLFRDIAQTRSFSQGAALNGIGQSAASQQVQDLEKTLGVQLLDRSRRPLVVTRAGQLYAEFCRDSLRRKQEFEAALSQLKELVEGTVKVAAIYSVGLTEMAQLEREFAQRRPEARIDVQYLRPEKVYDAVLQDEADIGLLSYPEPSREIRVIQWRQEEMVVAASPYHPLAGRGAIPAQELQGVEFVSFDEELPIRREIDRFLRDQGVTVVRKVHFDNLQMIKEAVAHRVGVSIMPARVMLDEMAQGRLVAIPIDGAELYRSLGIIHRRKKRFTAVTQAFLDMLCEKPGAAYTPA